MPGLAIAIPTLAALGLTTPIMLLGAAMITLPLLAHLLNRRARQRIVFPSIALLSQASASQASLFKFRRWLLLLLRCLAVLLIVFAFARPLWWSADAAADADTTAAQGTSTIIVLDRSASMNQRAGRQSAYAVLVDDADALLAKPWLQRANLVFADTTARAHFDQLTANREALRSALREADEPIHARSDLAGALRRAAELLRESDTRDVTIYTDRQRTHWQDLTAILWPDDTRITLAPLPVREDASADNVALHDPTARPATPNAGAPTELAVEVAHFGESPARTRVDLEVDGRVVESQTVALAPRQKQRLSFTHRFEAVGDHRVRFRLDGEDALAVDDTAYLAVTCIDRLPIVIVGDANPDAPGSDGYYLTRALAPYGDPRDRYLVTHVAASAVTPAVLQGAALVVVGQVIRDMPGLSHALSDYVTNGGSVLAFAGPQPWRDAALLPWTLTRPVAQAKFGEFDASAPVWRGLDHEAREALGRLTLTSAWGAGGVADEARVLARFADGSAAIASRPVGMGRVVAAAFSPAESTGDLGKYGVFVAMVQSLAEDLAVSRGTNRTRYAGQGLTLTATAAIDPQGSPPVVQRPDGTEVSALSLGLDGDRPAATLGADETPLVGFYTWKQGPAELGLAALNLDPRESDLRPMDTDVLQQQLEGRGNVITVAGDAAPSQSFEARQGRPLWGWLLLAAMGVLAVEMLLLGWWRR